MNAGYMRHAGETTIHDAFKDLREGLEANNDLEGGAPIIARLARPVQNNAIRCFERGGVAAVGDKRGEVVEDKARSDMVDGFPNRIGAFHRTGGRRDGQAGQRPLYFGRFNRKHVCEGEEDCIGHDA